MRILAAASLGAALIFSSCSTYTVKTEAALSAFERRDYETAEKVYSEGADESGIDQLLYLFDRGIVRHTAGKYADSTKDLLAADKLAEIKDYTAIATEIATIITNDRITHYKGEEFENVLISTFLALNYALEGKDEDALVECRRVNRKLEQLRTLGKRQYELNAFAQYLSGVLYERDGNWNNAYVDYKKVWDLKPEFTPLRRDLVRGALESDSDSEKDRWERALKTTDDEFSSARRELKKMGSLVVVYQNGVAPIKIESPDWSELPAYQKRYNKYKSANIYVDGKKLASTELLYDIEDVAFKNLKQKYATYITKRIAGVAAKVIIGNQVAKATGSQDLGMITEIFLLLISRPDLRAWLTLPQNLQMARLQLAPGKYEISLRPVDTSGGEGAVHSLGQVEIKKPGELKLVNFRGLND